MKTRLLLRRKSLLIAIGVSVVLCATAPAFGTKKNASIQFLVINDSNGRPVMNAEIVIHAVDRKGGLRDDSVELKSHQDGKAEITGIPYGKLRVEVISAGFKTFQKGLRYQPALDGSHDQAPKGRWRLCCEIAARVSESDVFSTR